MAVARALLPWGLIQNLRDTVASREHDRCARATGHCGGMLCLARRLRHDPAAFLSSRPAAAAAAVGAVVGAEQDAAYNHMSGSSRSPLPERCQRADGTRCRPHRVWRCVASAVSASTCQAASWVSPPRPRWAKLQQQGGQATHNASKTLCHPYPFRQHSRTRVALESVARHRAFRCRGNAASRAPIEDATQSTLKTPLQLSQDWRRTFALPAVVSQLHACIHVA